MTRFIGLCGPEGAGKTTVARELCSAVGGRILSRAVTLSFAEPIREMLRGYYRLLGLGGGEIEARLTGRLKETPDPLLGGRTPRYAMRTLGTEWGRRLMLDGFWINAWRERVERWRDAGTWLIVADDVRFENEVAAIRALGGEVIEIVRKGCDYPEGAHPSAQRLPDRCIDRVVPNDSMVSEAVRLIVQEW